MTAPGPRIDYRDYEKIAPAARAALAAVGKAVDESGLEKQLTELIKLRASQMNGCSFCVRYHLNEARRVGVDEDKLDMVAGWHDAAEFSDRERAALAWTEALTNIAGSGAPDDVYDDLGTQFSQSEIAFLTVAIAQINTWNRIAIGLRFTPLPSARSTAQQAA